MKDVGEAHYVTSLLLLEGGVAALTLTGAWQMRRQRLPWRAVITRSIILFSALTVMPFCWRGLHRR